MKLLIRFGIVMQFAYAVMSTIAAVIGVFTAANNHGFLAGLFAALIPPAGLIIGAFRLIAGVDVIAFISKLAN